MLLGFVNGLVGTGYDTGRVAVITFDVRFGGTALAG